ncbi:MAG: hypothetical protein ACP5D7_05075 [Limnospira sp.]
MVSGPSPQLPSVQLWESNNTADDSLAIASKVLAGELAAGEENWDGAIASDRKPSQLRRSASPSAGYADAERVSVHKKMRVSVAI